MLETIRSAPSKGIRYITFSNGAIEEVDVVAERKPMAREFGGHRSGFINPDSVVFLYFCISFIVISLTNERSRTFPSVESFGSFAGLLQLFVARRTDQYFHL
jgi:hypothetical protein